jgi:polysaccharide biosynthesis protein PslA
MTPDVQINARFERPSFPELSAEPSGPQRGLRFNSAWSGDLAVGLLVVLDACAVLLAGLLCDVFDGIPGRPQTHIAGCVIATLGVIQVNAVFRLYDLSVAFQRLRMIDRLLTAVSVAFGSLAAMAYLADVRVTYSSGWKFGLFLLSFLLLCAGRLGFCHAIVKLGRRHVLSRNVVVLGAGPQAKRLLAQLARTRNPWTHVVGVFDDRANSAVLRIPKRLDKRYPVLGTSDDLIAFARRVRVDEIFLALPWSSESRIEQLLAKVQVVPANVHLWPDIPGNAFTTRKISSLDGLPVVTMAQKPIDGWGNVSKWLLDKVLATLALVLLSPLLAAVACAIRSTSRGPVLFRQPRLGFNNQVFHVYKFRTMFHHARDVAAERLTTRDDPRVTRVGRILRRFSIDELPQIFNVLRGEMSLVGPRPHPLAAKAGGQLYAQVVSEYALRHKMKPGITGWAQISGWRGETDTEEKLVRRVEHDLWYLNNWSIGLDLYILLMTAIKVPFHGNAY